MEIKELINEVTKSTNEIQARIKAEEGKLLEYCKSKFGETAKVLFDAYPRLKSFGWTQYTPYFNDGDECTFSAHTSDADINEFNEYDSDEGDLIKGENLYAISEKYVGKTLENEEEVRQNQAYVADGGYEHYKNAKIGEYGYVVNPQKYDEEAFQIVSNVKAFLQNFDDDILKAMFGDHVKVIVTRDGVNTEEYNHD